MVFVHLSSAGTCFIPHLHTAKRHGWARDWRWSGIARCLPDSKGSGDEKREIPDYMPVADSETDWRKFRAELIAASSKKATEAGAAESVKDLRDVMREFEADGEWAHHIKAVEPGCLLVAHPLLFAENQTHFYRSVVLIFMHDDERGTAGLILNNPTIHNIGGVAGAEALSPTFKDSTLYLGGDVGINTLHVLHPYGTIQESREVVRGVYIGGLQDSVRLVDEGRANPEDFKWFGRYCGWAPGQVSDTECETLFLHNCIRGAWSVNHVL